MFPVPRSLQRLAIEVDGWLEMRCADKALQRMGPLLAAPGARAAGLAFRVRAQVELGRHEDAVTDLEELRELPHDPDWLDLTEGWCRKRLDDLPGAVACMERLLQRSQKSAIGHFNLGCYLALLGDRDRAIEEVTIACGLEEQFRSLARDERDLESLSGDPRFEQLLSG